VKAYIKADTREDPSILEDLIQRLEGQGIKPVGTSSRWQDIPDKGPFLYLRNPYIRFDTEQLAIEFNLKHPEFSHIECSEGEILCVNPGAGGEHAFVADSSFYYKKPLCSPLPIMIVTHRRPAYLKLALNSIFYSCKHIENQKLYIIASNPDEDTESMIRTCVENNINVEGVITDNNLGYTISNFGSKFFKLKKFIHFEDDGILPESLHYQIPYWTQQLNYRSTTAEFVAFRISEYNKTASLSRAEQAQDPKFQYLDYPELWNYVTPKETQLPAVSGLGLVIDSEKMYRDYEKSSYQTDLGIYRESKSACILNVPIYHIGANQLMDFGGKASPPKEVDKMQKGVNIRTGETREIDLSIDWISHV
jgi:hypothetical protein